ncbi:MAG: UDP-3-O-(3-hydroxymyristoyl) glucosamine N-acyltransferase [Gammaproteobacteria bacterium BRH_c0]|nr:MAG: UDP-3-O-(3-hydroxymyristoyl) glucosamine N-acyltransferase [Gammaproteobacteria bacterium BRH_c0]
MTTTFALRELADFLKAELQGDPESEIRRLNTLQDGGTGDLAFLASNAYRRYLQDTRATAVILSREDAVGFTGNALIHPNPYVAYAKVTALFQPVSGEAAGIHPTAVVDETAIVPASACIGPWAVIESGVQLGEAVIIGAGCFIGANSVIGDNSRLHPHVTVYQGSAIGQRAVVHSGAVLGADGFGFANEGGRWLKIHQLGAVEIGNDVEIGACTTIDRGALGNTVIGSGVIIDNLVQIAHNVRVGDGSAIAGCVGIAGSTVVGKHCVLAGGVGLVGHIELCDGVTVTACSMVTSSIATPGVYSSGTPFDDNRQWKKNAIRFGQLDEIYRRLAKLEKQPTK